MKNKYSRILLLLVIALFSLSACGGEAGPTSTPTITPTVGPTSTPRPTSTPTNETITDSAKKWLEAQYVADGETMARNSCNSFSDESWRIADHAYNVLGYAFFGSALHDYDLSDTTYTVIERNANSAIVEVGGQKTRTSTGLLIVTETLPSNGTFEMGYESGKWKVCGYTS
jgi:hypothetical protein